MLPEDRIRFWHIIDEAVEACTFVEGLAFDEFVKDGKTADQTIGINFRKRQVKQIKKLQDQRVCSQKSLNPFTFALLHR